ncbi:MAG: TIGR00725 family protein [Endomicrobia bacterium]|nr:TIGR00725 family protein [Endomicrobiia bacterium]MCX7940292.1 TIGR00725 family protein [Endomicrobiia bacterium]MDW8055804.1 TIGR00725 family protein [Elusimicrobiota bacterium]
MKKLIAVIGGSVINSEEVREIAFQTGKEIALRGYVLVCGGMGGVMEEAAKGAKSVGGLVVGILPGKDTAEANPYVDIPIITAMSHARNAIIVRSACCVIAIDGEYGTLSEIALAKVIDKPVFGIKTWDIEGVIKVQDAKTAIDIYEGKIKL